MLPHKEDEYTFDTKKFSSLKESKLNNINIVSAGPSCRNFNWQIIRGQDIFTINDSIFYLPLKATYHVYNEPLDKEAERYHNMTRKFPFTHKFTTLQYKGWHKVPLYNDKNLAFMLALNIVIELGYKNAILYGFDFDCIDGYIHWWDKKPELDKNIIDKKMKLVKKQKVLFDRFLLKIQDKLNITFYDWEKNDRQTK